jgi:hypothetical protein
MYLKPLRSLQKNLFAAFLPPTLHEHIQDMAVLIHSPPPIMALLVDREKDLSQVPRVAGLGPPMPERMRIGLAARAAPLPNRFIGHDHPAGAQEFFHVTRAEIEAAVEPDGMADDLSREAVVFVQGGWCGSVQCSLRPVDRYQESAFLS